MKSKNSFLAGFLSFIFSGLGQFYVGKIGVGLALLLAYLTVAILSGTNALGEIVTLISLVAVPIVWLGGIIHAVISARRINQSLA